MYSLLFLGLTSFALSLLLTPLVRSMAWRFGIVDQPDQQRKVHAAPIPRIGGLAETVQHGPVSQQRLRPVAADRPAELDAVCRVRERGAGAGRRTDVHAARAQFFGKICRSFCGFFLPFPLCSAWGWLTTS